jgi:hypothetical protein
MAWTWSQHFVARYFAAEDVRDFMRIEHQFDTLRRTPADII